ncbi:MAG: protein-glutamate O-methyltransferase [Gammaproteobacteria bacterium]|nr:protein-glutamate O-methyltransferase [Gammaproteobacteria bacterium]HXK55101.1 protein-glutamate O-methyltransferase [Gammaproteobacteria bacterium]
MQEKVREFAFTQRDFDYLREIANRRTGIVVGEDKFDMFYSRLSRRVRKLGLRSFSDYCELIRTEPSECEVLELINSITTNLTSFFRENHHFDYLKQRVLPELVERNRMARRINVWSAGCSTGEEPYSIAISMREALPDIEEWQIGLLASDIDSRVLAQAASAVYPMDRINGISQPCLRRWFQKGRGGNSGMVRVKPEVSKMVKFRQVNLMDSWSLEAPLDVIFCRNVIIYFDKRSKAILMNRYADALHDGGFLFIGHSESLFRLTDRFELIGNTVYRKKA